MKMIIPVVAVAFVVILILFFLSRRSKKQEEEPDFFKKNKKLIDDMNNTWLKLSEEDREKYGDELVKNVNVAIKAVCPVCPMYRPPNAVPLKI
jgi:hypothetical protein